MKTLFCIMLIIATLSLGTKMGHYAWAILLVGIAERVINSYKYWGIKYVNKYN